MSEVKKMGIDNVKKLFTIVLKFVNAGDKMGHKNNWGDRMSLLFGFFPILMGLSSIKWNEIGPEFKDIDQAEQLELITLTKETFDLVDDELEEVVETALEMVNEIIGMVLKTISFVKRVKSIISNKK